MWWCNLCSLKTSRRGNVIRHIREVHKIDDPNAQNATKDSNTGGKSDGKDKTTKVSNVQQRTIMDAGIRLSEHITDPHKVEGIFLDTILEWMKKTMNRELPLWMDYTLQNKLRNLVMI